MVRSGESAGVLDTVLLRLSDNREREQELRRRIQSALAYPILVLSVGVFTVVALLAFFLPRVVDLFKDYRDLPWATRVLIGASNFFSAHWYWLVLVVLLVLAIGNRLAALERGRSFIDGLKLRVPVLGRFLVQSDIARFARTLALLIEAGIPIDRALGLSADTLANTVMREEIATVRAGTVHQGVPFSTGLKRTRHFPVFVSNMAAVGEQSGRLEESLTEVSDFYEKEVEHHARLVTSLLEPALILVVGAIVGFIVSAMLLPIFEIGTRF
jgi:type II secretory pathway component PulF